MLCYRDKEFCRLSKCKKFDSCDDALTDKVRADAIKWRGNGKALIASSSRERKCFESK